MKNTVKDVDRRRISSSERVWWRCNLRFFGLGALSCCGRGSRLSTALAQPLNGAALALVLSFSTQSSTSRINASLERVLFDESSSTVGAEVKNTAALVAILEALFERTFYGSVLSL